MPPDSAPNGGRKAADNAYDQARLVADEKGNIVHISEPVPGNIHDKKMFDKSKVKLPDNAKEDSGCLGTNIIIPVKASKLHLLTQKQKNGNTRFSGKIIAFEHVCATLPELDPRW